MASRVRLILVFCLVVLAVVVVVPGSAIGSSAGSDGPPHSHLSDLRVDSNATANTTDTSTLEHTERASVETTHPAIELTEELRRLVDQPGVYEAQFTYEMPENARLLEVTLPEGTQIRSTRGFQHRDERRWNYW